MAPSASVDLEQLLSAALAAHRAGRLPEAAEHYDACLRLDPRSPAALYYGGVVALQIGQPAEAARRLDALVAIAPQHADIWYHLGLARERCGAAADAERCYREVRARDPRHASAGNNLGLLLRGRGALDEAVDVLRSVVDTAPAVAEHWQNLGLALHETGILPEAIACYRRAEALDPDAADAVLDLGCALADAGDSRAAVDCLQRAIARFPGSAARGWVNLGSVYDDVPDLPAAAAAYRSALAIDPRIAQAWSNLGRTLYESGDIDGARASYRKAIDVAANPGLEVRLATMLPPIPESVEHVTHLRAQFVDNLAKLALAGTRLSDPLAEVGEAPFHVSYHGRGDDRDVLGALAAFYLAAAPDLAWTAPHCSAARAPRERIRIGFISHFLREHSVGRSMQGLIRGLPRDRFDVRVLRIAPHRDDARARAIDETAQAVHRISTRLAQARAQIAALELDVLFYPDLGMEAQTYFLSFARLAPVQCTTWGHPTTSAVPAVDYFISHTDLEPPGSERHYSERLIRIGHGAVYPDYEPPPVSGPRRGRRELGLPEGVPLYVCPQSAFKLMPEFDPTLAAILRGASDAVLLVPESHPRDLHVKLRERWSRVFPDAVERVHFFPRLAFADYVNLIEVADVMLDPFPVGGGITTFDALATGTPIVTLRGAVMRGRFAAACLARLELRELIATDPTTYAEKAIALGRDPEGRASLRERIRTGAATRIYRDTSSLPDYAAFFEAALAQPQEAGGG